MTKKMVCTTPNCPGRTAPKWTVEQDELDDYKQSDVATNGDSTLNGLQQMIQKNPKELEHINPKELEPFVVGIANHARTQGYADRAKKILRSGDRTVNQLLDLTQENEANVLTPLVSEIQ